MCYMETVGVRELRQDASRLLRMVAEGTVVEITSHGRPVARLVPPVSSTDTRNAMLADGRLLPARAPHVALPDPIDTDGTLSAVLQEMRDEDAR